MAQQNFLRDDNAVTFSAKNGNTTSAITAGDILYASEGVEPLEAIRAYSIDGAYAVWEEDIKGTIEPGKLADMVVIDRDPTGIEPDDIRNVKNLMTVVAGKIVYEA